MTESGQRAPVARPESTLHAPKLTIVSRGCGGTREHSALVYWKEEAKRRKATIRDLEKQNERVIGFVKPLHLAHLKMRAKTKLALERLGMSDADTILQLAAAKSDAEFGPWFADLVRMLG
jgi:hypothetical protein